jgi:hypothetical protein
MVHGVVVHHINLKRGHVVVHVVVASGNFGHIFFYCLKKNKVELLDNKENLDR